MAINWALRAVDGVLGQIEGLLIAFTDANRRDAFRQYFDKNTDFRPDLLPFAAARAVGLEHNRSRVKGDIGLQVGAIEVRDDGLYMQAQLDVDNPAFPLIWDDIQRGAYGYSAETTPAYLRVGADGHVDSFPIFSATISKSATAPQRSTTVAALRGAFPDLSGDDNEEIILTSRGVFDFVPEPQPVPVPARRLPARAEENRSLWGAGIRDVVDPVDQFSLQELLAFRMGQLRNPQYPAAGQNPENFDAALVNRFMAKVVEDSKKPRHLQRYVHYDAAIPELRSDLEYVLSSTRGLQYRREEAAHLRSNELLNIGQSGYGAELVFSMWEVETWHSLLDLTSILSLIPQFNMPSKTFQYPVVNVRPKVRRVLEPTDQSQAALTSSVYPVTKAGENKIQFAITGAAGFLVLASEQLLRWSQIQWFADQQREAMNQLAIILDRTIIDGDETASSSNISHWGTDPTATDFDWVLNVDGIRHYCLITNSATASLNASGQGYQAAHLTAQRKQMGYLGKDPSRNVLLTDLDNWYGMLHMPEVLTLDSYGPDATVKTGEVGKFMGVSVIAPDWYELTNASGQIEDSHDTTLSSALLVRPDAWKVGRGMMTVGRDRVVGTDTEFLYGKAEIEIQCLEQFNKAASLRYNIQS